MPSDASTAWLNQGMVRSSGKCLLDSFPKAAKDRGEQRVAPGNLPYDVAQAVRKSEVLDEESLAGDGAVEERDRTGHGGPARGQDGSVAMHCQSQEVAVGAPAVAQPTADSPEGPEDVAAAKKYLGGAERARSKVHLVGRDLARHPRAVLEPLEMNGIAPVRCSDVADQMQRTDLGPLAAGTRKVVEVKGVPGLNRTTDFAVTAVHAGTLLDSMGVAHAHRMARIVRLRHAIGPRVVEPHCQLELAEPVAEAACGGGFTHRLETLRELALRQRADLQHLARPGVPVAQGAEVEPARPSVGECMRFGFYEDVRVDQGSATHSGALDDRHVSECAQVDPAVVALGPLIIPDPVPVGDAGIVLHRPLATAFQHQHRPAGLGQSTGQNGSAESAADDDGVMASR